jgi:hypothetical protein
MRLPSAITAASVAFPHWIGCRVTGGLGDGLGGGVADALEDGLGEGVGCGFRLVWIQDARLVESPRS